MNTDDFLPLAPAAAEILLVLAGGKMHGYGIMQEVARQSGGRFRLGPGTLYDNLQRLMAQGLVEEAGGKADSRRRYYRLTASGRSVLSAEVARLEDLVRKARLYLRPGRA
jgi:DNA-binding PadR family transcriptional regulator